MELKPKAPAVEPQDDEDLDGELSAADHDRIRAKARKMVAADRRKALEARALEVELEALRGKAGQMTGDPQEDEIVSITIHLAENAPWIKINGKKFEEGVTYPVPRHVARSLMDIMWRAEVHEHSITDKPLTEFYRKPRHTAIQGRRGSVVGVVNGPRSPGEGLSQ